MEEVPVAKGAYGKLLPVNVSRSDGAAVRFLRSGFGLADCRRLGDSIRLFLRLDYWYINIQ